MGCITINGNDAIIVARITAYQTPNIFANIQVSGNFNNAPTTVNIACIFSFPNPFDKQLERFIIAIWIVIVANKVTGKNETINCPFPSQRSAMG